MLLAHTHTIDQIQVWKRHNSYFVVVHDEWHAIAELTHVDVVANSADGWGQTILLHFALQKLLHVDNVKATRLVDKAGLFLEPVVILEIRDDVRWDLTIVYGVEVSLVQVTTVAHIKPVHN